VAGYEALHKKYGKLPWKSVVLPALLIAKNGFEVSGRWYENTTKNWDRLSENGKEIFGKAGKALRPASLLVQKKYAEALKIISSSGAKGFYVEAIAKDIVNSAKAAGGILTLEDLKSYQPRWLKPITHSYKGYTLQLMPPPSSGGVVMKTALALFELKNLESYPPQSALEYHLLGEILSRSFRGRTLLGDPAFAKNPLDMLLAKEYINELAHTISVGDATELPPLTRKSLAQMLGRDEAESESSKVEGDDDKAGSSGSSETKATAAKEETPLPTEAKEVVGEATAPKPKNIDTLKGEEKAPVESPETTHISVLDSEGNAVSLTQTLNGNYGSGVVSRKYGIVLNNEMDDFTTQPGKPNQFGLVQGEENQVQGGKRPLSSMSPTIVEKEGKTVLVVGAPGGPMIITSVLQTIYRFLATGYDIDLAIQTPRVHHQYLPNKLHYDSRRLSPEVVRALKKRGHELNDTTYSGKVYAVGVDKEGFLSCAFDSRSLGGCEGY
jgi:gamma-glutamyltranspeptidase/glutathione hydrolase